MSREFGCRHCRQNRSDACCGTDHCFFIWVLYCFGILNKNNLPDIDNNGQASPTVHFYKNNIGLFSLNRKISLSTQKKKVWSVPQQASDHFLPYRKAIKFSYPQTVIIITHLLKVFEGSRGTFFKKFPLRIPARTLKR